MSYEITASIVTYKNDRQILNNTVKSFLNTNLNVKLYISDNSPTDSLKNLCTDNRCEYIFNGRNLGFGRAHNTVMQKILNQSKYHLVLNPDISFQADTLEKLICFLEEDQKVGLVIPKVLDFESNTQYVCKRLPAPIDLAIRRARLNFLNSIFIDRLNRYEMRDKNYDLPFEAPSISGCFMLFRTEALKKTGLFDDRFFMYMEDIDLSRRVHQNFKTCYFPYAHIFHGHARESYQWNKLLLIHTLSAIKYFNKWGWFFDSARKSSLI